MATFEEAKKEHAARMGDALGAQYSALWAKVVHLHIVWKEFVELFGSKPERIDLLNNAAGAFFRTMQDELWDSVMLHLTRLTDPPKSANRSNLTLRNLSPLIGDSALKDRVTKLVDEAVASTAFCRDWRNRRIAHTDLDLALDLPATPLAEASRLMVNNAVNIVSEAMRAVHAHYLDSDMRFDLVVRSNGALALLYVLHDGVKAQKARRDRLASGKPSEDDFRRTEL